MTIKATRGFLQLKINEVIKINGKHHLFVSVHACVYEHYIIHAGMYSAQPNPNRLGCLLLLPSSLSMYIYCAHLRKSISL